jgi:hypothetical protein
MKADDFQKSVKPLLEKHYSQVILEWSIDKNASDSMQHTKNQYFPRTDIAVGPFSTDPGHNDEIRLENINSALQHALSVLQHQNTNPRCLLAIEVVFSGSSKHILGDILNASVLGLYGVVVGSPEMMPRIWRNAEYLKKLVELEKLAPMPFQNVLIVNTDDFVGLLN